MKRNWPKRVFGNHERTPRTINAFISNKWEIILILAVGSNAEESTIKLQEAVFTETWLNDSFKNEEILDSTWSVYRNDRDYNSTGQSRGGGVLIATNNHVPSQLVSSRVFSTFDHQFIKVHSGKNYTYIGVVYFPPNSDESSYNNFFAICNDIFTIMNEDDNIVILGDFNRPSLSFVIDDFDNQLLPINFMDDINFDLISTFYGNDLHQVFRYPNSRGNWLDLAFSNAYDTINVRSATDEKNLFRNSIHHNALVLELPYSNHKFSNTYNNEIVYDFMNADYHGINYALSIIDWETLLEQHNLDNIIYDFYSIIFEIIDNHIPKIRRKDKLKEPWLDRNLRHLRKRRNKLHHKIKHSGNDNNSLINDYNELANEFKIKGNEAYDNYVQNIGNSIMSNPKKFFDFINTKRKSSGYPISMCMNGRMSSSPTEICNFFADNFQQIYRPELPSNNVNFNPAPLVNNTNPLFEYFHLSVENVFQGISSLDVKKGSGPDLLPPIFLYNCRYTLSNPLTSIFNISISTGVFPSAWKNSYLIPIHKKGDKTAIENYRGIAIQSAIPKLFEKLVTNILAPVINPLLNNEQHGFRTGRSTTSNFTVFTSDVLSLMEKGFQVDIIYTDFSFVLKMLIRTVKKYITKLENTNSCGNDGFCAEIFKKCCELSPYLTSLIYTSFVEVIFPEPLKINKVVKVPKMKNEGNTSSYRPILISSIISLSKNSDYHSLPEKKLDSKKKVGIIFFDLSKAFDFVDGNLLLRILYNNGITGTAYN
ncbi:uncharacterized protein LOC129616025 [Condylostylus longicornis]|uniref:uncharacterized protein LOC129616025 n=1 Tax=Condylostylus longicornis TaxID=2530218 RepID=UPI00244E1885|nr:uncharacterized protein LOC129616025 [Condylostylus longicornis]